MLKTVIFPTESMKFKQNPIIFLIFSYKSTLKLSKDLYISPKGSFKKKPMKPSMLEYSMMDCMFSRYIYPANGS